MIFLVTGATGFVGRSLCRRLLDAGHQVRGAVRSRERTGALLPGVSPVVVGELGGETRWEEAVSGCDVVLHLAARVHVMDDRAPDPREAYRTANVVATERLARAASRAGVRRLVLVSSVKVHGEECDRAYTEGDPLRPRDPYGVSKMEAEQVVKRIGAETGVQVVIVRPPLVYGPGVKANFLKMMRLLRLPLPLPLASVQNRRSAIYVENLAHALIHCSLHPRAAGETYLVSDGAPLSTPRLLRETAQAMGRRALLFPFPPALLQLAGALAGRGAVDRLTGSLEVDDRKIRSELGWVPPHSRAEGVRVTAEWLAVGVHGAKRPQREPEAREMTMVLKRSLDIVAALLLLLCLLGPMLVVALLVKLTSRGPVLYWSDRVGRENRVFRMPKFRTMRTDTPAVATHLLEDPGRFVTPVGRLLRKTSLDELPQLLSILRGEMTFVGPRPALFNQDDLIELRTRKGVHLLTPGLTGWAQVNGRDDLPIPEKVSFDEYYLTNASLSLDLRILSLTLLKVLRSEGVQH